jgi:hypothetical protein
VELENFEIVKEIPDAQLIVAVAAVEGQAAITDFLEKTGRKAGRDFWFFC